MSKINKKSSFIVSLVIGIVLTIMMVLAFYTVMASIFKPIYVGGEGICKIKYDLGQCAYGVTNCDPTQTIDFDPAIYNIRSLSGTVTSTSWLGAHCDEVSITIVEVDGTETTLELAVGLDEDLQVDIHNIPMAKDTVGWSSSNLEQTRDVSLKAVRAVCVNAGGIPSLAMPANWIDDFTVVVNYVCGKKMFVISSTTPFWTYNPNSNNNEDDGVNVTFPKDCLLRDGKLGLKSFDYSWIFETPPSNKIQAGLRSGCLGPENCTAYPVNIYCHKPINSTGCDNTETLVWLASFSELDYDFKYTEELDVKPCISLNTSNDYFNYYCLRVIAEPSAEDESCVVNGIDIKDVSI